MCQPVKIAPLFALAAIMLIVGIAATPAALTPPTGVKAVPTTNAGELNITWEGSSGAQFYAIAWVNVEEANQFLRNGRDFDDAIYFVTVPSKYTAHTVSGLKPSTEYYVVVGAKKARYEDAPVWSGVFGPVTTAGQHGAGFCPITGLPIPPGGYLNVGDTKTWSDATFTLNSATIIPSVTDSAGNAYTPAEGNKYLRLCSTWNNRTGGNLYYSAGVANNLSTDAGIGFISLFGYGWLDVTPMPNGTTRSACDAWLIPESAATAVYVIYDSNSEGNAVLYQIDLNVSASTPTTPLTNQQLTQRVKPALGQIVVTNSAGETSGGTGFVVRSNGLMVTNRHVVDDAQTVTVWMNTLDGQTLQLTGNVLGRGILADLAVVQLPAGRTYATLPLADSGAVSGLDEVSAWGYPGGSISGTYPTVTRGVISSKGIYGDVDFLQTDAAINPGNSGGPLVDQYGSVVGVNTMKTVDDTVDNQGFAIASNEVSNRLNILFNGGRTNETYRNAKFGYGYSVEIPRGWYLGGESELCTGFDTYNDYRTAAVCAYDLSNSFTTHTDKLAAFAEWKRNDLVRKVQARGITLFQPISFTRVAIGGREFYRLEYRYQWTLETCIENRIMLMGLSSSPEHYGFTWRVGVCEHSQTQYGAELDAILNSFRP